MDLIVSQVRRSVVSVVQQYSHIRYLFFLQLSFHQHSSFIIFTGPVIY